MRRLIIRHHNPTPHHPLSHRNMPLLSTQVPGHVSTDFQVPKDLIERKDVSVSQLYQWNATENPNFPLFVYHDGEKLEYITYVTANAAIDRAARFTLRSVGRSSKPLAARRPIVAILANTGAFCSLPSQTLCCSDAGARRYDHLFLYRRRHLQVWVHRVPHLDAQHRTRHCGHAFADGCDAPASFPRRRHGWCCRRSPQESRRPPHACRPADHAVVRGPLPQGR